VRATEVGTKERRGYDILYGHNSAIPTLTRMTVREAMQSGPMWTRRHGSSAAGGYQFMNKTLIGLFTELKLSGSQLMVPDLQDRLAYHLLIRRGYLRWMNGTIGDIEFAKALAMEWASFPVLIGTKGAHRNLQAGQSYYAGDGVNKALVKPDAIRKMLAQARGATIVPFPTPTPRPAPDPVVVPPKGENWLTSLFRAIAEMWS
jgi:muramidase (phage lysozyme)